MVSQFFGLGQKTSGTNYFYTKDHLGSTRELVDGSGAIKTRYEYDPYGQVTQTFVSGSVPADFQYDGYYFHARSGLNLTWFRQYNSAFGRWLSRDPLGENRLEAGNVWNSLLQVPDMTYQIEPKVLVSPFLEITQQPARIGLFGSNTLNLYTYVKNSTINHTDPMGLDEGDWDFHLLFWCIAYCAPRPWDAKAGCIVDCLNRGPGNGASKCKSGPRRGGAGP